MLMLRPLALAAAIVSTLSLGRAAQDIELSVKPNADGLASLFFESGSDATGTFVVSNAAAAPSVLNIKNSALPDDVLKLEGVKQVSATVTAAALLETNSRKRSLRAAKEVAPAAGSDAAAAPSKVQAESLTASAGAMTNRGGSISLSPTGTFSVAGQEQWKLISDESFGKGTIEGWTSTQAGSAAPAPVVEASTCARRPHVESDYFLGTFGNTRVMKTFTLPAHKYLRITARVHFLDAWDGGRCSLRVDGKLKWAKQHTACRLFPSKACQPGPGSGTLDACADPNFADTLSEPVDVAWKHDAESIELAFRGHLSNGQKCTTTNDCEDGFTCSSGGCVNNKATWGVDDLRIYVR